MDNDDRIHRKSWAKWAFGIEVQTRSIEIEAGDLLSNIISS